MGGMSYETYLKVVDEIYERVLRFACWTSEGDLKKLEDIKVSCPFSECGSENTLLTPMGWSGGEIIILKCYCYDCHRIYDISLIGECKEYRGRIDHES